MKIVLGHVGEIRANRGAFFRRRHRRRPITVSRYKSTSPDPDGCAGSRLAGRNGRRTNFVQRQVAEVEEHRQVHVTDDRSGDYVRHEDDGKLRAPVVHFRAHPVHGDRRYETGHQRERDGPHALVFVAQHVFLCAKKQKRKRCFRSVKNGYGRTIRRTSSCLPTA